MDEFEVIKSQMEARRSSLADKLEALEHQVSDSVQEMTNAVSTVTDVVQGTVESVKDSVEETVATVKDTFQDTVDSVKDTFDFAQHMDNHPWICMTGAFGLGFMGGKLIPGSGPSSPAFWDQLSKPQPRYAEPATNGHTNGHHANSWFESLSSMLGPEIDKLKGLAIAYGLGLVRDNLIQAVPPDLGNQVKEMIDNFTSRMGAQPLHDNLAPESRANRPYAGAR